MSNVEWRRQMKRNSPRAKVYFSQRQWSAELGAVLERVKVGFNREEVRGGTLQGTHNRMGYRLKLERWLDSDKLAGYCWRDIWDLPDRSRSGSSVLGSKIGGEQGPGEGRWNAL